MSDVSSAVLVEPVVPVLLDAKEVKALLKIKSATSLDTLIRSGALPKPVKIAQKRLWRRQDVADAINKRFEAANGASN